MSETVDEQVLKQYKLVKRLGKGSYGIVWKGEDRETGQFVAIKKCFDCFQNATDSQRTYREIRLLQQLNGHTNLISLYDVISASSGKDLYVVSELMDADLGAVIRSGSLEPIHVQCIAYQLLCALKYLHSAHVVHRDIKPANILINAECKVKLCDFGLARIVNPRNSNVLTGYVATRWYRAPELLLECYDYGPPVDVWAVGTITGEMIQGKAVFPGTSTLNQLERIIEVTGWPGFESGLIVPPEVNRGIDVKALCEILPRASVEALDFIRQLIQFSPKDRVSAATALTHSYIAGFYTGAEPVLGEGQSVYLSVDDNIKLRPDEYRTVLQSELDRKRKDIDAKFHALLRDIHIST